MLQTRCGDDADGEMVAVAGVVVAAAVQRDGGRARECVRRRVWTWVRV
jgi:hypothetical protein